MPDPNSRTPLSALRDTCASMGLRWKIHLSRWLYKWPEHTQGKQLLLLASEFPPATWGGVYRPLSIVRAAAESGWEVAVVCGPSPRETSAAGRYLLGRVPSSVKVIRLEESGLRPIYKLATRVDGGFETALETTLSIIAMRDYRPSVILASGPPFQNFIAARYLAAHYKCPFVIDYRDEWTDCPFGFVQRGHRDRAWEWRCLKSASRVIYTTKSFLTQAHLSFPKLDAAKCRVFPNGFDPMDLPVERPKSDLPDGRIVIAFLGNLSFHTPPDAFLHGLRNALELMPQLQDRVVVRFYGNCHPVIAKRMDEHPWPFLVERFNQVPKPEAVRQMQCSTVLLLLNPPALTRYIPGKLFDYIASGTPVLVYGKGGEAADAVECAGAGVVVDDTAPQELAEALLQLTDAGVVDSDRRRSWLARHNRSVIAQELLDELASVSGAR